MRVKHLKMQSYRGIGDLELDFDEAEPTILVGVNGSGKTSILGCIAKLLNLLIDKIKRQDNSGHKVFEEQDVTVDNRMPDLSNEITIIHAIKGARITENSPEDSSIFSAGLSWGDFGYYPHNELDSLGPLSLRINGGLRSNRHFSLPIMVFYPVQRSFNAQNSQDSHSISKYRGQHQLEAYEGALTDNIVDFHEFFNWFKHREDIENEHRAANSPEYRDFQLQAVRSAIYEFLPGFEDLRIKRTLLGMFVRKNGYDLNVGQLSDGEKCILAMIGDMARRLAIANPSLENPLEGSGIVLIDEIELHLHPRWQRGIVPALTRVFPNCQFIITTHSPQVISDIPPQGIYLLESTPNGVIAKHPEISFGRDTNQILETVMNVPERPNSIKNKLRRLFRLIEEGNLSEAKQLQSELESLIGDDEPEFAKADVLIRRREILRK